MLVVLFNYIAVNKTPKAFSFYSYRVSVKVLFNSILLVQGTIFLPLSLFILRIMVHLSDCQLSFTICQLKQIDMQKVISSRIGY